ncbi:hypothetical protein AGRA3207_004524 [Actinomadura graeca]|uniref:Uncharacterized protein n=1 Tax=Actinomadura graeca TaxID=2750812 RepID=A0ABX8QX06_9ACTN|nr:hypothetical protein [Actinomadura graeca]QXJ23380.1 hypothetical protein AGRA3207_004524 [Actinomadura graeca]
MATCPLDLDEAALELILTTHWMVTTGRRLYERPVLHQLGAEELIDFWADDRLVAPVPASSGGTR